MPHSSCEESCNHHHLPSQYPFSGNYPGTDAITNPVNFLRYPANAGQSSRATFSGVRAVMVLSGNSFSAVLPIVSSVSAVASLPMYLINHFTHAIINYTEQQGSLRSYADVAETQRQDKNHRHHHRHLPKPIQALFHLPDSGYRYMAEKFTPQNPQNLAKLKTCLFYGNLALSTTITTLGVVALVGGAGAVATTPVGWGLIGLSAVSAVTFVGYSAVKNKYTTLSRQAYQEVLYLNSETKEQNKNISNLCQQYKLQDPKNVLLPSFSSYLGLDKPKKFIKYFTTKSDSLQEKPTTVSEVLLNSALLNFVATSNLEEQEKKDIVEKAQEKFKPKDNFSGSIDHKIVDSNEIEHKIVDSNEFLYEIATFLAKQEVEKIEGKYGFDISSDFEKQIPLLQNEGLRAENSKNTFSSRHCAFFSALRPKSKEYYNKYIETQQLLACYRIVQQEFAPKNTHGDGHGHGRDDYEHNNGGQGHGHVHDDGGRGHGNVHNNGGHGHGHENGHGNGHGHYDYEHDNDCCGGRSHVHGCCSRQEFAMPADIEQFKSQLPSYANPNLYNGNRYLDVLNRKVLGKGAQDFKLTLRGIKELTKKTAKSVMPQILAIAKEENKIPNEGFVNAIPKAITKPLIPQSKPMQVIEKPSIDANTYRCCFG